MFDIYRGPALYVRCESRREERDVYELGNWAWFILSVLVTQGRHSPVCNTVFAESEFYGLYTVTHELANLYEISILTELHVIHVLRFA